MQRDQEEKSAHWYNTPDGASERYKKRVKRMVDGSRNTIYTNPCFHEGEKSLKCKMDGEEDCSQYFENYRMCRKFWTKIEKDRKRKGIEPRVVPPEDRDRVRQEYMKSS